MAFQAELVRQVEMKRPLWKAGSRRPSLPCLGPPMTSDAAVAERLRRRRDLGRLTGTRSTMDAVASATGGNIGIKPRSRYSAVLAAGLLWSKKARIFSQPRGVRHLLAIVTSACEDRLRLQLCRHAAAPFVIADAVIAIATAQWAGRPGGSLAARGRSSPVPAGGNSLSSGMYDRTTTASSRRSTIYRAGQNRLLVGANAARVGPRPDRASSRLAWCGASLLQTTMVDERRQHAHTASRTSGAGSSAIPANRCPPAAAGASNGLPSTVARHVPARQVHHVGDRAPRPTRRCGAGSSRWQSGTSVLYRVATQDRCPQEPE